MAKSPITAAQRQWLGQEVTRLLRDDMRFATSPIVREISGPGIIRSMERLIEQGWIALVSDEDGRPQRLEWKE